MKVMVTGAGALLGQGIIRALRASSLRPWILAVDPSPLAVGLYWADRGDVVPIASDAAYIDRIAELLGRVRPDALLVGTDVELAPLAGARSCLESAFRTRVLVSSPEVVAIADDKWLTYRFLTDHGLPAPTSCLPGGEDQLIERVGFPLIVKPRVGARSVGVCVIRDEAELASALRARTDLIIQEYVGKPADEYTAGVLWFGGECNASIVMRRDLRDGNTYRAYVEEYPELNRLVSEIAARLCPYGPANFQFRLGPRGPRIFEINARFSGTTPLRALVGFNEVEMSLRHVVMGEAIPRPEIRSAIILRHWAETVVERDDLVGVAGATLGNDDSMDPRVASEASR